MNWIENLFGGSDQAAQPLHVGEVMALWTLHTASKGSRMLCMTLSNHTNDSDLKELMEHLIAEVEEPQGRKLEAFMREQGLPMAPAPAERPKADANAVPPGARFTDEDIANLLVVKLEATLQVLHVALSQTLRDDVHLLCLNYYVHLVTPGAALKKLMTRRGWLYVPPPYQRIQ